jgi:hypothetical protein
MKYSTISIVFCLICCQLLIASEYSSHASNPFAVIDDRSNFQYVNSVTVTQSGTFLISVTTRSEVLLPGDKNSGHDSFHVYTRRSEDRGKTWQDRVAAYDGGDVGPEYNAEMGQLFPVPAPLGQNRVSRIYQFHIRRNAAESIRFGKVGYSCSEDDGRNWSGPDGRNSIYMLGEPDCYQISRGDKPWGWHLMGPGRIMSNGMYILPVNISTDPEPLSQIDSELVFIISKNILTEQDPAKVEFEFYPQAEHGVRSPMLDQPARSLAQEPQIVELNDHKLMCVFRTGNGRVEFTVSDDFGKTWQDSQPLRYWPENGPIVLNPNCACPFSKLSNGRYALLHCNNDGHHGGFGKTPFDARYNRNPVYLSVGREVITVEGQPMMFTAPRLLCSIEGFHPDNPRRDLTYGALIESQGEFFHFYNALWQYIQVNKVDPALLEFGL